MENASVYLCPVSVFKAHWCDSKESFCGRDEIYLLKCHFIWDPWTSWERCLTIDHVDPITRMFHKNAALFSTIFGPFHGFILETPFSWTKQPRSFRSRHWRHKTLKNRKAATIEPQEIGYYICLMETILRNPFWRSLSYQKASARAAHRDWRELNLLTTKRVSFSLRCWYIYTPREHRISLCALVFPLWIRHL